MRGWKKGFYNLENILADTIFPQSIDFLKDIPESEIYTRFVDYREIYTPNKTIPRKPYMVLHDIVERFSLLPWQISENELLDGRILVKLIIPQNKENEAIIEAFMRNYSFFLTDTVVKGPWHELLFKSSKSINFWKYRPQPSYEGSFLKNAYIEFPSTVIRSLSHTFDKLKIVFFADNEGFECIKIKDADFKTLSEISPLMNNYGYFTNGNIIGGIIEYYPITKQDCLPTLRDNNSEIYCLCAEINGNPSFMRYINRRETPCGDIMSLLTNDDFKFLQLGFPKNQTKLYRVSIDDIPENAVLFKDRCSICDMYWTKDRIPVENIGQLCK